MRSASASASTGMGLMDSTTTRTSCPRLRKMVAIRGSPSLGSLVLLKTCRPGGLGSMRVIFTGEPPHWSRQTGPDRLFKRPSPGSGTVFTYKHGRYRLCSFKESHLLCRFDQSHLPGSLNESDRRQSTCEAPLGPRHSHRPAGTAREWQGTACWWPNRMHSGCGRARFFRSPAV